jgi:hypothetical protein
MNGSTGVSNLSVEDLIAEGRRRELELVRFYERAIGFAEYDVRHLFEKLVEESRARIRRLEEAEKDLVLLRTLTEPIAD